MEGGRSMPRLTLSWTGALVPPIAWSLHLLVCYFLVTTFAGEGALFLRVLLAIVTAAAIVPIAVIEWQAWRRSHRYERLENDSEAERERFMLRFGILAGIVFGAATLLTAWPAYVLSDFG